MLTELPESLCQMKSLTTLDLRYCGSLTRLPEYLGQLSALHTLKLGGCSFLACLPESIGQLSNLQELSLWECKLLKELPASVGQLEKITVLELPYRECTLMIPPPSLAASGTHGEIRSYLMARHTKLKLLLLVAAGKRRGRTRLPHELQNIVFAATQ